MGYKFQFVTLAGFHSLNHGMFELAQGYRDRGMAAYSALQEAEFASEARGYTATRHQHEVGAGYFDAVSLAVSGGAASTTAMAGSTETDQFIPPGFERRLTRATLPTGIAAPPRGGALFLGIISNSAETRFPHTAKEASGLPRASPR